MGEYNINSQWTLLERAKRSADGKRILPVLDVLQKSGVEAFVQDAPYFPANQGLKHRVIRTTSRPASTRRTFYKGVGSTITTTQVIYEPVILFEQRSEIDEDHLDTLENPNEARRVEDEGHIMGVLEDVVKAIFTDARTSGEEYIDGFAARMATLSYPGYTTSTLPYVWDNGGTGSDLCSIYLVEWGPKAVHMLYPSGAASRGNQFGISVRNKGKEKVTDTTDTTTFYYAYVTQIKKWCGVAVWNDWKFARVANVEAAIGASKALNENILIQALNEGKFNRAATRIYCNPRLKSQVDIKAAQKQNVLWPIRDVFGQPVPTFQGAPVRVIDETILTMTESAIT